MSIEASPRRVSTLELEELVHGSEAESQVLAAEVSDVVAPKSFAKDLGSVAVPEGYFFNSMLNVITPLGKGVGTTTEYPQY